MAKKSPKPSKKRKTRTQKKRRTVRKAPSRSLVDTYDSWISKEMGKGGHHAVSKQGSSRVPADTFQEWMKKQTVKGRIETAEPTRVSSTYDDWIVKQVAEKEAQLKEEQPTQIQTIQNATTEIVVKPATKLANPEKPME